MASVPTYKIFRFMGFLWGFYYSYTGLVLQFHGCFWHGRSRCYRINKDATLVTGDTMDSRFERTLAISKKIKDNSYELIEK